MFALSKLTNKFKAARVGVKFNPPTLGIEYNTGNGDEKKALKEHGTKIPMHLHETIRSREACMLSTEKAIDLANRNDADLHVLHVSTEDEAKRFYLEHEIKGQPSFEDKRITCEVCIPHLFFCSKDYKSKGSLIKCNPSIKDESDKKWLRKALKQGSIDYVATDHAPHLLSQKHNNQSMHPLGLLARVYNLQPNLVAYP